MIYGVFALAFAVVYLLGNSANGETLVMKDEIAPKRKKTFSDSFDALFRKYGAAYDIDPLILKTIAANESAVGAAKSVAYGLKNPNDINMSVSSDGKSWGLMQTTLPTSRQFESTTTEAALNNPEISIRIAAKYLQWVKKNYESDLEYLVRSYNGGPGWKKTVLGPSATAVYWAKFQRNYELVKADGV